ncbi:cold-shock protein [Parapedobacter tibetensis]|uniref:cold-shock protein n=1 Tax=Parapedobacter tibetensis TaxID=2972951 RepID=UPI00214DC1FE|nr:cold shock domain-containing protein [Parapedobacter tibetensis]
MGRSQETFSKKENTKKRLQKKKEKEQRREEKRQTGTSPKSKSLDEMLAYVDENGNLSTVPPDPKKLKKVSAEEIMISTPKLEAIEDGDGTRIGRVSYFNEAKGYGFISDAQTGERVFIHINDLAEPVLVDDQVEFVVKNGPRGLQAESVKKLSNT